MSKKGYVTADHDHFKKAKLEYRNWMQAIFREGIQNSIDADANKITITYKEHSFSELEITLEDNGKGMSLDTLLNVLLKMGGSKKDGENQIGGFGYAKSILFFAHNKYLIKSRNYQVEGIGGEYTYKKIKDYKKGTYFSIIIEKDYFHTEPDRIEQYLTEIIDFSKFQENVKFIVNGKNKIINNKKFKFNINTDLGSVHFNDSGIGNTSVLWVRVNGLTMFKHETYQTDKGATFEGVLDINKSPLEMLTANRDGLQYCYSSKLNQIFEKLSNERDKFTYEGMFNFVLNNKDYIEENEYTEIENRNIEEISLTLLDTNKNEKEKEVQIKKVFQDLSSEKDKFQDFFVKSLEKINEKYYPLNFAISTDKLKENSLSTYKEFFKNLLKQKNIRVAIMWDIITKNILSTSFFEDYIEIKDDIIFFNNHKLYRGFIFGEEDLLGQNSFSREEGYHLSINPLNEYVSNDYETILDISIHECTHFIVSNHNDSFCFNEFLLRRKIQKELKHSEIKTEIKLAFKEFQNKLSFS